MDLVTSKESSNPKLFFYLFYLICAQHVPSNSSTMIKDRQCTNIQFAFRELKTPSPFLLSTVYQPSFSFTCINLLSQNNRSLTVPPSPPPTLTEILYTLLIVYSLKRKKRRKEKE